MDDDKPLLWGFFKRRRCVVPTWRGWLLIAALCAILAAAGCRNAYYFLAMNERTDGGVLVVEGWGPDSLMAAAASEFKTHHYDALFATGGPIEKGALLFNEYRSYADLSVATLDKMGIDPALVHAVYSDRVRQDRTFSTAVALKKWLHENGMTGKNITLITMGPHARRSHLLYEKAFGGEAHIGVIAVQEEDIDPRRWWTTSQGFRSVVDEMVAYFYARFLFHAPAEK